MSAVLAVVAAGAVTYALRLAMPVLLAGRRTPPLLERASSHLVPAVFAAMAATAVTSAPVLAAACATVIVTRRTGSSGRGLVAGLPVLWLAQAVL